MDGITVGGLINIWLESIIHYWVLIAGIITAIIFIARYLNNRTQQQQQNNNLLKGILESSESMDSTIKEMSNKITVMNTEVKVLRKEHDLLANDHNELKKEVRYIRAKK